jgi:hypothetical protein
MMLRQPGRNSPYRIENAVDIDSLERWTRPVLVTPPADWRDTISLPPKTPCASPLSCRSLPSLLRQTLVGAALNAC